MRKKRLQTAALVIASAALTAAGCSNSAAQPTPTPSTTTAATTTAATPSDLAIDQAKKEITAYYKVSDQLSQNPTGSLAAINSVAAGDEVAGLTTLAQGMAKRGIHTVGDTTITSLTASDASITKSDAEVAADVCYDVSKVQGIDAQGAPLPRQTMQAGAPDGSDKIITVPWRDRRLAHFIVHNSTWPDPSGWRVTKAEMRNATCG